jgi:hypothetical protein
VAFLCSSAPLFLCSSSILPFFHSILHSLFGMLPGSLYIRVRISMGFSIHSVGATPCTPSPHPSDTRGKTLQPGESTGFSNRIQSRAASHLRWGLAQAPASPTFGL